MPVLCNAVAAWALPARRGASARERGGVAAAVLFVATVCTFCLICPSGERWGAPACRPLRSYCAGTGAGCSSQCQSHEARAPARVQRFFIPGGPRAVFLYRQVPLRCAPRARALRSREGGSDVLIDTHVRSRRREVVA